MIFVGTAIHTLVIIEHHEDQVLARDGYPPRLVLLYTY